MISSFGCTAKNICKWSSKQICLSLKFDEVDVCMNKWYSKNQLWQEKKISKELNRYSGKKDSGLTISIPTAVGKIGKIVTLLLH